MEDSGTLKKEVEKEKKNSKRWKKKYQNQERTLKKVKLELAKLNSRFDSVLKENLRLKEMMNASEGKFLYFLHSKHLTIINTKQEFILNFLK